LEFKTERRRGRFDFKRIDPDHPTAGAEGNAGDFEEFLEKAPEVGDGDTFAERGIGDEESDTARAVAGNLRKITEVLLDEIGADS